MKKVGSILLILFIALSINAQFIQIEDVGGRRFNGVKPILTGESQAVSGYYTYYMLEKEQKGVRTIEFSIVDKELTNVTKTQISMHRTAVVNNTVFNGNFMLISYDDKKNKQVKLNLIDKTGKIVMDKALPAEKRYLTKSVIYADATGEGFYIVTPSKGKKVMGYAIEKVDNQLEQVWRIEEVPVKGSKSIEDLINNKDRFIIWENNSPSLNQKIIKPALVCYDAKTGQKIYTKDGYDGMSTILYNKLRIDEDGSVYAGGAYVDGEKTKSVNSAGIYLLKLNVDGKEVLYNKVNNAEKIQAALKGISDGFTIGSKEKVFVEDVIVDGEYIYIISEMFRKNFNATPVGVQWARDRITGKYIGSKNEDDKPTKAVFEIMDFILFKFSQEGKLIEIKPIAKAKKLKITCWNQYASMGGMRLARTLKEVGWFDYAFVEKDVNGQLVMICKDNAEAEKGQKGLVGMALDKGPQVFSYTLGEDYAQKTINLKQQGKVDLEQGRVSYFNTLRNSQGKIALVYFQRELNKVSISLEETH